MITSVNNQNHAARPSLVFNSQSDEVLKQKQALQNQKDALRDLMSNGVDIAEISDEARAMAVAAREKASVFGPYATRDGRVEQGKNYDKILEDLRAEYGEKEAMKRFDKIMRDDGFEVVTEHANGIGPNGGFGSLPGMAGSLTAGVNMPPNGQGLSTSNLQSYSSVKGVAGADGGVDYLAETYANYASDLNPGVRDALTGVYEKNLAAAQKDASFDLRGYMRENFGDNPSTSAVSASTDLGAVARDLFQKAGVEVGGDERVRFSLNEDGSLYVGGQFDEAEQARIDAVLEKDPGIAKTFKAEYDRVAMTDSSSLDGAYSSGGRSVSYGEAQRSFVFSGSEPSAVVMTDYIGVQTTGYNYQKKVADSFDINADARTAMGQGVNIVTLDFETAEKVNDALQAELDAAAAGGGTIASTMTKGEYNAIQAAEREMVKNSDTSFGLSLRMADGEEYESKMHYPSDSPEAKKRAAEAEQALQDLAADPRTENAEVAYIDERGEAQRASVKQLRELFELFAARDRAPGTEMIGSIIKALRGLGD